MSAPTFPKLDELIETYFHQDYDLIASTLEGLVSEYKASAREGERGELRKEIATFTRLHAADLESAYAQRYAHAVHPRRWGLSVAEFLSVLDRALV